MTLSIRERAFQALHTRLQTVSGVSAYRSRDEIIDESEMPALVLIDGGHSADYNSGAVIYTASASVEIYLTSSSDSALCTDLNALYQKVMDALMGEPSLGGVVIGLIELGLDDPTLDYESNRLPNAVANLRLEMQFMTSDTDISLSV